MQSLATTSFHSPLSPRNVLVHVYVEISIRAKKKKFAREGGQRVKYVQMAVAAVDDVFHGAVHGVQDGKDVLPHLFGLELVVVLAALDQLAGAVAGPLGGDDGGSGARRDDGDVLVEVLVGRGGPFGVVVDEGVAAGDGGHVSGLGFCCGV
jgi:hypothetical protein